MSHNLYTMCGASIMNRGANQILSPVRVTLFERVGGCIAILTWRKTKMFRRPFGLTVNALGIISVIPDRVFLSNYILSILCIPQTLRLYFVLASIIQGVRATASYGVSVETKGLNK